jgi:AraC family transcriptional regulator of adaptative response / DNA-3-methyladenine glycosylase II
MAGRSPSGVHRFFSPSAIMNPLLAAPPRRRANETAAGAAEARVASGPAACAIPPDLAAAYTRALDARDPRFDGVFFVGITTTRIYCRPICPARVSHPERRRLFASAALAERDGYRPCLRCRPELAPGSATVDARTRLARVAERRIAAGALNGRPVGALARELGVSERHLRRALALEVGVSPVELAQTHRLLLAKQLLADTTLPVTQVAYASGFESLRRFNAVFREAYRMAPSAVRRRPDVRRRGAGVAPHEPLGAPVQLTFAYRPPLAWDALLSTLALDAVTGVEVVRGTRYGRTVALGGCAGVVWAEHVGAGSVPPARRRAAGPPLHALRLDVTPSLVPVLMPLLAGVRRLFDLDADPTVIDRQLADAGLSTEVADHPGVRLPGAVDGFDVALRIVLRGRVWGGSAESYSGDAARRVAAALGAPIETGDAGLTLLAPTAERVADAGLARLIALGVSPRAAAAGVALARAVAERRLSLAPGGDPDAVRATLIGEVGVDARAAAGILARALGWTDAFACPTHRECRTAASVPGQAPAPCWFADRWRPWRAYGALRLWFARERVTLEARDEGAA